MSEKTCYPFAFILAITHWDMGNDSNNGNSPENLDLINNEVNDLFG
jgi:hypothetical protein